MIYRIDVVTEGATYPIYEPRSVDMLTISATLNLQMGLAGTLTMTVAKTHPNFSHILPLTSEFFVYQDDTEIFRGRMISKASDFYLTGKVICESDLGYLMDSLMRPYSFTGTITEFVDLVLTNHNSQVEAAKQFTKGSITVIDSNNYINRSNTDFSTGLAALQEKLVRTHGGYFRTRLASGVRYLDYVLDYGTNTQVIRFGQNLLDLTNYIDASKIITCLIPTGATIENEDGTNTVVDIKTVNEGVDYIVSAEGVAAYGQIWGTVSFEDVTIPANLLAKAVAYLEEQILLPSTLEVSAVDLSLIDVTIDPIALGKWVTVEAVPQGISKAFLVQKYVLDIMEAANNKISLGGVVSTSTSNATRAQAEISERVNKTAQSASSEINRAVANATAILVGSKGGYLVIELNEDGLPMGLLMMDAPTIEEAENVFRLGYTGFGFSSTGIDGPYGNAWTLDGQLVADYITTGTMYAERIKGGTLTLGGEDNVAGLLSVLDAGSVQVVRADKDGLYAVAGQIGGFTIGADRFGTTGTGLCMDNTAKMFEAWSAARNARMTPGSLKICAGGSSNGVDVFNNSTTETGQHTTMRDNGFAIYDANNVQKISLTQQQLYFQNDLSTINAAGSGFFLIELIGLVYYWRDHGGW